MHTRAHMGTPGQIMKKHKKTLEKCVKPEIMLLWLGFGGGTPPERWFEQHYFSFYSESQCKNKIFDGMGSIRKGNGGASRGVLRASLFSFLGLMTGDLVI